MTTLGQQAIVIGASMAGLLAARALADYYEQVTVIERDHFSSNPEVRKGTPQAHHPHFLLSHGGEVLEDYFPGILDELVAQGACDGDADCLLMYQEGGALQRVKMGARGVAQSRPLLEFVVRQRLLALPNITAIQNCDALGLITESGGSRVTGVRMIRREAGSAEEQLKADLVVDAGGRGSRIIEWLTDLGYAKPEDEKLHVDIQYVSRLYRRQPEHLPGLNTVVIAPTSTIKRGGVIIAREDGCWHTLMFGYLGDRPPTDEQGMIEFARTLASPELYHLIRAAEPASEPMAYRFTNSQRRHYEKLSRFPEGLLVMGDALCSFNPIYGQGMTVSALQSRALHQALSSGTAHIASRFFKAAASVIDTAWEISAGSDLKIPEVQGERTRKTRFVNWYMSKLMQAAHYDPVVTVAFLNVVNFKAAPPSVMHPRIALRVLWSHLRGKRTPAAVQAHRQTVPN